MKIGYLSANIAGDTRYTATLTVDVDVKTKEVHVTVRDRAPVGGMDGPGGSYDAGVRFAKTLQNPSARSVVDAVKEAIDAEDILKIYGKPTKNFKWGRYPHVKKGISIAKAKEALALALAYGGR